MLSSDTILLAERRPSRMQTRVAVALCVGMLVAFVVVLPFRDRHWANAPDFIPILDTTLFFADCLTAILLYVQFSVLRSPAILAMAMAYLFSACLIVLHLIAFPTAATPAGAFFGPNPQAASWLHVIWRLGLPIPIIVYAMLKGRGGAPVINVRLALLWSLATVCAVTGLVVVLVATSGRFLPLIMMNAVETTAFWRYRGGPLLIGISLVAIVFLWRRRTSLLDTWLLVALWAGLFESILLTMTASRFSLCWYMGLIVGVLSSGAVLIALLCESTMAFAGLTAALATHERERAGKRLSLEVVVGSIAHELQQPLTAMLANSEAAMQLLGAVPPNLQEAQLALADIQTDGQRASDVIRSIQATSADSALTATQIDIVQLIRETLTLLRTELYLHELVVQFDAGTKLPRIQGNKGQMFQVLVNLITNAVDSMRGVMTRPRILTIAAKTPEPTVISIDVLDNGIGIRPEIVTRIFDPFFTTKSRGTGLGLAICKSIVEAHSGNIAVLSGRKHGSAFRILLPVQGMDSFPGGPP